MQPSKRTVLRTIVGVMLASSAASSVEAGVADSPIPTLSGQSAQHVFTIPGVIKNNDLETIFICTSLDRSTVTLAVEVFAATSGGPLNDVLLGEGVETLAPGETRTFATEPTVLIHEDDILPLAAASLRNGSARIISTSKRIGCTAFLLNETTNAMTSLKVLSKTKQRGE